MAKQVTGKQRASRIPLDYYKGRDGITKGKLALSALGFLVPIVWLASGFSFGGPSMIEANNRGRMRYSRGAGAQVHAVRDGRCEACDDANALIGWKSGAGSTSCKVSV